MITNNDLKYYSSLLNKKYRKLENKFIVEGIKTVLEGINSNFELEIIFITNEFKKENKELITSLSKQKNKIVPLTQKEFYRISDTQSPQGIAAVFLKPDNKKQQTNLDDELIIYLDNISDPGNLGTIIRNCGWFGIKNILLSENCAEFTNPKVIRSSAGSLFHLNIYEEVSITELIRLKKNGYTLLTADTDGHNIFKMEKVTRSIICFSNEAVGPSEQILKITDKKVTVPGSGKAESLNVASASAVILSQLTK